MSHFSDQGKNAPLKAFVIDPNYLIGNDSTDHFQTLTSIRSGPGALLFLKVLTTLISS